MRIAELFRPVSPDDFLLDYFNRQPLHAAGPAGRFARFANPAAADQLAWDLERELEAPVGAEQALDAPEPRRGAHDLIVLQIAGVAEWTTYGKDSAAASADPDGIYSLEPGSALYLPRAVWRSVHMEGAPSTLVLHIQNPTGADLIEWMAGKIKEIEVYQADLPRFASPAAQAEHLSLLRRSFGALFRGPSLLQRYSRRLNRQAPAHAVHGHAWTGTAAPGEMIALAAPRTPKVYRSDAETIQILVEGREIYFPEDAAPLLQYLLDRAPVAVPDFFGEFAGEFDKDELSSFLEALCRDGVITILESAIL